MLHLLREQRQLLGGSCVFLGNLPFFLKNFFPYAMRCTPEKKSLRDLCLKQKSFGHKKKKQLTPKKSSTIYAKKKRDACSFLQPSYAFLTEWVILGDPEPPGAVTFPSKLHCFGKDLVWSMPAPPWDGRQGAEAALVSNGITVPISSNKNYCFSLVVRSSRAGCPPLTVF